MVIYLAGAISKKNEDFCRDWRNKVTTHFAGYGVDFINPIAGKDLSVEYNAEDIYSDDIESVEKSDIVFAEMDLNDYSYIGTSIELHHAYQNDIKTIVWGNTHRGHYFLDTVIDKRFDNLVKAVIGLEEVLSSNEK